MTTRRPQTRKASGTTFRFQPEEPMSLPRFNRNAFRSLAQRGAWDEVA